MVVQLGFCVPIQDEQHYNEVGHHSPYWHDHWDGGVVGGRPSWLMDPPPKNLPTCSSCQNIAMRFVCQLYAPLDDKEHAFHRTLYIFACPNLSINHLHDGISVWRCQLPRDNVYWPFDGSVTTTNNNKTTNSKKKKACCVVCGIAASGKCPKQQQFFCGSDHQRLYQKVQQQQQRANSKTIKEWEVVVPNLRHKVYELVVEEEPTTDDEDEKGGEAVEANNNESSSSGIPAGLFPSDNNNNDSDYDSDADLEQSDLNAMIQPSLRQQQSIHDDPTDIDDQDTQQAFVQRISKTNKSVASQVLRYDRWNDDSILWLRGSKHQPTYIPNCPNCGHPRRFECQLMPQLLSYIGTNHNNNDSSTCATTMDNTVSAQQRAAMEHAASLLQQAPPEMISPQLVDCHAMAKRKMRHRLLRDEWGTVVVYTCVNSCSSSRDHAYATEFAWRQPPVGL